EPTSTVREGALTPRSSSRSTGDRLDRAMLAHPQTNSVTTAIIFIGSSLMLLPCRGPATKETWLTLCNSRGNELAPAPVRGGGGRASRAAGYCGCTVFAAWRYSASTLARFSASAFLSYRRRDHENVVAQAATSVRCGRGRLTRD